LRLRELHLNLETVPAAGIPPEVQLGVSAGRGGGHERLADIGWRHAKLSGAAAVNLDLERWVIERLRVLQVAERIDLDELRADLFSKRARGGKLRPLHGDFNRRRRA